MNAFPKLNFLLCCCLLLTCGHTVVHGQQWTDTLKEIEIQSKQLKDTAVDKRASFSATQATQTIDKIYKDLYESQSLANLLAQQTSVFVKSYGVNSMSSLSLRGASAAQSAVLWNGVPITNPAVGVADISLLQTGLFSDITLKYGSSAALYGSGNIGGALLLDNQYPSFNKTRRITATLGGGSFGAANAGINTTWQNHKWSVNLHGFYQKANNDIKYKDDYGNQERLDNAQLEGGGGLLSIDYNLKNGWNYPNNERLYLKVWTQAYDREIPPALFEAFSVKRQKDVSVRTMLGYERNTRRSSFYAKGFYSNESLHYQDSSVSQDYKNTTHQIYQETGWKYRLDNPERKMAETWMHPDIHQILIFAPIQFSLAEGNNINNHETQFRPAIAVAYSYEGMQSRLNGNVTFRQEWVNGAAAPLLPGMGLSYQILQNKYLGHNEHKPTLNLLVRANVQRTYRIPTLNELYYFPGGNPDLKPEQGWSEDLGYTFQIEQPVGYKGRIEFTHELNAFNRNISDWIYWLGGAIWTPHNIAKVHSRGLETNNKITYKAGDISIHLGLNYTYVLSTTAASYLPGDGSIGKQIPYTPRYNIQANAGMQWRSLFLNINQTYTGYRFVTVDESQYLEPYATTNFQATFGNKFFGKYYYSIVGQLQNIFNRDYEVVNARSMPGRNFLLQFKLTL